MALMPNNIDGSRALRPFRDNVLVKPEPPPQMSELIATPNLTYRPIDGAWATVVRVGDTDYRGYCAHCKRPHQPCDMILKPGDRVLMNSPQSGDVVLVDGVEHRLLRTAELELIVLEDDDPRATEAA